MNVTLRRALERSRSAPATAVDSPDDSPDDSPEPAPVGVSGGGGGQLIDEMLGVVPSNDDDNPDVAGPSSAPPPPPVRRASSARRLAAQEEDVVEEVAYLDDSFSRMLVCAKGGPQLTTYDELSPEKKKQADRMFTKRQEDHKTRTGREYDARRAQRVRDQIATRISDDRSEYLVRPLPEYKCLARPLTPRETQKLEERRESIDRDLRVLPGKAQAQARGVLARAAETDTYDPNSDPRTLPTPTRALEAIAEKLSRAYGRQSFLFARELRAKVARRALLTHADTDGLQAFLESKGFKVGQIKQIKQDYHDFMNEERRIILRTIQRVNTRIPYDDLVKLDYAQAKALLDAQLEADTVKEFMADFESEGVPVDTDVADARLFPPCDPDALQHCANFPPIDFTNPNLVDYAKTLAPQSEAAKTFCETTPNTWNTVIPLRSYNEGQPIKQWHFPNTEPNIWPALRRIRELKPQLNIGKIKWDCQKAFEEDPLIAVKQTGYILAKNVWDYKEVPLLDQLIRKYFTDKDPKNNRSESKGQEFTAKNLLPNELLRCFPELKPLDAPCTLNSILDFICWWDRSITTNTPSFEPMLPKTKKGDYEKPETGPNRLVYALMAAPDCSDKYDLLSKASVPVLPAGYKKLRQQINERVNLLKTYVETAKLALDYDVCNPDPEYDSVLLSGGMLHRNPQQVLDEAQAAYDAAVAQAEKARTEAAEATKRANEGPLSTQESPSPEAVANYQRAGELIDQQRLAEAEEERTKSVLDTARDERKKTTTPTEEDERMGRELYEKWRALNPSRS